MKPRHAILLAIVLVGAIVVTLAVLHWREQAHAEALVQQLLQEPLPDQPRPISFESMRNVPTPVLKYFRHALTEGQAPVCIATLRQTGELRMDTESGHWMPFTATETVVPGRGFIWNARIALPYAHLKVLDSFNEGIGSGRINAMTTIVIGEDRDNPQLNSGALHRYLAEAAWFPTALLPGFGVRWSPIDETRALATLTMNRVTVSLEFRFNERNEIESVYSPGRWGTFNGGYEQRPWEGHFRNYQRVDGMRIPGYGEVGWYSDNELQIVWRGKIEEAQLASCRRDPH